MRHSASGLVRWTTQGEVRTYDSHALRRPSNEVLHKTARLATASSAGRNGVCSIVRIAGTQPSVTLDERGGDFVKLKIQPSEAVTDAVQVLLAAMRVRDPILEGHSLRVARYADGIAEFLGLSKHEIEVVSLAAVLHDIGMFGVSERIILKSGTLTDQEMFKIQGHPEHGAEILYEAPVLAEMAPGVMHHHENIDGSGYPRGLRGDEIPLAAKIIRAADTFDAMTTRSHYQSAIDTETALAQMKSLVGARFDEKVMGALVQVSKQSPLCQHP